MVVKEEEIIINWKELSKFIDNLAWDVFNKTNGDREVIIGFREIMNVIENKDMLIEIINKYK